MQATVVNQLVLLTENHWFQQVSSSPTDRSNSSLAHASKPQNHKLMHNYNWCLEISFGFSDTGIFWDTQKIYSINICSVYMQFSEFHGNFTVIKPINLLLTIISTQAAAIRVKCILFIKLFAPKWVKMIQIHTV